MGDKMTRVCCVCKRYWDEENKTWKEGHVEGVLTHTYCSKCMKIEEENIRKHNMTDIISNLQMRINNSKL
jgi:hypothetical protein